MNNNQFLAILRFRSGKFERNRSLNVRNRLSMFSPYTAHSVLPMYELLNSYLYLMRHFTLTCYNLARPQFIVFFSDL